MGLRDIVSAVLRPSISSEDDPDETGFDTRFDSDGMNFVIDRAEFDRIDAGQAGVRASTQLVVLRMLEEQGLAQAIPGGFHVPADAAASLHDDMASMLELPPPYGGEFTTRVEAYTTSQRFGVRIFGERDGEPIPAVRSGALLRLGAARFRLTRAQLRALESVETHTTLEPAERSESANVRVIAELQRALREGMRIDLAHFSTGAWQTSEAARVGVVGTLAATGDLILSPSIDAKVNPDLLDRRWGQLQSATSGGVLRVENNLVLLDDTAVAAAREVLQHRTISRENVAEFLRTPSAFLDASLVDLDLGFSVRVEGIGRLTHVDFGEATPSDLDWFARTEALAPEVLLRLVKSEDDLARFEREYDSAAAQQAANMTFVGEIIDIREPESVAAAVEEVKELLANPAAADSAEAPEVRTPEPEEKSEKVGFLLREAELVVERLHGLAREAVIGQHVDRSALARNPYPHQQEGIEWMSGLMKAARHESSNEMYRLQGALLADDMGLGKTYMALVAIQQHMALVQREEGAKRVKPTLVVAPLSLIENWEDELAKTFTSSPFADLVVLQSGRDLPTYRVHGAGRENMQLETALDDEGKVMEGQLRIALHVGADAGAGRLDLPGRLVLTTYDTLRDFQFSLSQIDWGVVVFDEAQAIKNPDALRTRAAKALKADFKLLATGTPVENNLGEFWCLIDTAQPGLLGDWATFRSRYLLPLASAEPQEVDRLRVSIGRELHSAVGPFMLRRLKEEHLDGLPDKILHTGLKAPVAGLTIHDADLALFMPPTQAARYDAHLDRFRSARHSESPIAAVAVLQSLRLCSLHPDLDIRGSKPALPSSGERSREQIGESAKLQSMMEVLRDIRGRGEKVIVFAISKDLQVLLALWIQHEFGIRPDIINGDTSAVTKAGSGPAGASRRQILQRFEAVDGFNVIVMSPIAAGVGLTVVGANHVVHLERHWNPAKEAQATDRVYRIGQTRDVHVYYPAAQHPRFDSFDVLIDRLLASKVSVKDAIMAPGEVSEAEMAGIMAGV